MYEMLGSNGKIHLTSPLFGLNLIDIRAQLVQLVPFNIASTFRTVSRVNTVSTVSRVNTLVQLVQLVP